MNQQKLSEMESEDVNMNIYFPEYILSLKLAKISILKFFGSKFLLIEIIKSNILNVHTLSVESLIVGVGAFKSFMHDLINLN